MRRRSRSSTATTATCISPACCSFHSGSRSPSEIVRPRHAQFRDGIDFRLAEVESVDLAKNTVHLVDGPDMQYDVLVIATGATLPPQETEGLQGPEWGRSIHTFYSLQGATDLRRTLDEL